jgi:hypothetical protein
VAFFCHLTIRLLPQNRVNYNKELTYTGPCYVFFPHLISDFIKACFLFHSVLYSGKSSLVRIPYLRINLLEITTIPLLLSSTFFLLHFVSCSFLNCLLSFCELQGINIACLIYHHISITYNNA